MTTGQPAHPHTRTPAHPTCLPHPPTGTEHLFLVWYQRRTVSVPRALAFVTSSASIRGATGTIYQVVDDRHAVANANLKPELRANVVAMNVHNYQGSVLLGRVNAPDMQARFTHHSEQAIGYIADHKRDTKNVRGHGLSNVQHWVERDVVEVLEVPSAEAFASAPR